MFFDELKKEMVALRVNLHERHASETAAVKRLFEQYEDKTRQKVAGLIGARNYRQFEGTLDAATRGKVVRQVKSDISQEVKTLLLVVKSNSLKDKLLPLYDQIKTTVYQDETDKLAGVWASLLPEGVEVKPNITEAELATLRQMPLAGLATRDYTQKILLELYLSTIQAIAVAFTDAQTFEGGIKFGLAEMSKKFMTAQARAVKLASELITQSSNQANADVAAGLEFKVGG